MDDPKVEIQLLDRSLEESNRAIASQAALSTSLRLICEALSNIKISENNTLEIPADLISQLEAIESDVSLKLASEKEDSKKRASHRNDIKLALNNRKTFLNPPSIGDGVRESLGLSDLRIVADLNLPLEVRLRTLCSYGEGRGYNDSNFKTALRAVLNVDELEFVELLPHDLPFQDMFRKITDALIPQANAVKALERSLADFSRRPLESFENCYFRMVALLDAIAKISTKFAKPDVRDHFLSLAAMQLITPKTEELLKVKIAKFKAYGKCLTAEELKLLVTDIETFETGVLTSKLKLFPDERSRQIIALPVAALPGLSGVHNSIGAAKTEN